MDLKAALIEELSNCSLQELGLAISYAKSMALYGVDVTQAWETASQNTANMERAYRRAFYDAMKTLSREQFIWHPVVMSRDEKTDELVYEGPMPDDEEEVLVTTVNGFLAIDTFNRNCEYYGFDTYEYDVLAWAKLPKPYTEENE